MCREQSTRDEIQAHSICCRYLRFNSSTLQMKDCPDLQDNTDDVGIEVRNVMDKTDGKNANYVNRAYDGQHSLVEKDEVIEKMGIGGKNIDLGFAHIFADSRLSGEGGAVAYLQHCTDEFVKAYEDKLSKLNQGGYQIFGSNKLFLLCDSFDDIQIKDSLTTLKKNKKDGKYNHFPIKFDEIYAYTNENIYAIDGDFKISETIQHKSNEL